MKAMSEFPIGEELAPAKTFEEMACLAIDRSGSMYDKMPDGLRMKSDEVDRFLFGDLDSLVARLKAGLNSDKQAVAALAFDDTVSTIPPRPLNQIEAANLKSESNQGHGNRTAIGLVLREAFSLAVQWIEQADPYIPRFVIILLMSDGEENCGTDPIGAAAEIKRWSRDHTGDLPRPPILIATAPFGANADLATLTAIASPSPKDGSPMCKQVACGQELRDHFMASISASTAARLV